MSFAVPAKLRAALAEEDEFISKAPQAEIKAALAKKPNTTVYSYPGQNHAFSRHGGAHHTAELPHSPTSGHTSFSIANCDDCQTLLKQLPCRLERPPLFQ